MRSLGRLGAATLMTLMVAGALLVVINVVIARERPGDRNVGRQIAAAGQAIEPAPAEAVQGACRVTVMPGEDISAVLAAQPIDAVVCLARGVHKPFVVTRSISAGVVVRGEGPDATFILTQRDGVTISDTERFTLAELTIRGGNPAGVYATRARGLALRGVRIQGAAFGVHADDGSTVLLDDVTLSTSTDFGLLVRRRSTVTGEGVHVRDSRAIGVGVVDGAAGLTLRNSDIGRADPPGPAESLVAVGADSLVLEDVTIQGGNPAGVYAARVPAVQFRRVQVQGAVFGVHADDQAVVAMEDVTLSGGTGVGLLLQRGASVSGDRLRVLDTSGTGVSAINSAAALTLRDSEIGGTQAAALFVGIAGCAALPPASLFVPDCFYQDLAANVSSTRLTLERVSVHDAQGPGVVLFPGVQATVTDSEIDRAAFTGLFAWGATVNVNGSTFDDNAEHAIELRAYPDPRQPDTVVLAGSGTLSGSTVQETRPLDSGGLGGGVLIQGAQFDLMESTIQGNAAIGVSYQNAASGAVSGSRIANNGGIGLCLAPGTSVSVEGTTLAGNALNGVNACGGYGG